MDAPHPACLPLRAAATRVATLTSRGAVLPYGWLGGSSIVISLKGILFWGTRVSGQHLDHWTIGAVLSPAKLCKPAQLPAEKLILNELVTEELMLPCLSVDFTELLAVNVAGRQRRTMSYIHTLSGQGRDGKPRRVVTLPPSQFLSSGATSPLHLFHTFDCLLFLPPLRRTVSARKLREGLGHSCHSSRVGSPVSFPPLPFSFITFASGSLNLFFVLEPHPCAFAISESIICVVFCRRVVAVVLVSKKASPPKDPSVRNCSTTASDRGSIFFANCLPYLILAILTRHRAC